MSTVSDEMSVATGEALLADGDADGTTLFRRAVVAEARGDDARAAALYATAAEEGVELALLVAGDEDRHAGLVMGDEVARLGEFGNVGQHDRELAEQHLDLALEPSGVGVVRDRIVHDLGERVGRPALVQIEDLANDLAFFSGDGHRTRV